MRPVGPESMAVSGASVLIVNVDDGGFPSRFPAASTARTVKV